MNERYESADAGVEYVRRVPAIAALMSAALPGFGQLYNGQMNRAIWFFLVFCILTVPVFMIVALFLPAGLTIGLLAASVIVALIVWLWGIVDAWRVARCSKLYLLRSWQTTGLYTAVFLICSLLILPLTISYVRSKQVEAFRVPSSSMLPTIQYGDFMFANKSYNCPNCRKEVQRGDVAVFVYPNIRNRIYVKRIIGLPGDSVSSSDGVISVNDQALSLDADGEVTESIDGREWKVLANTSTEDFSIKVEPGHVFVLGDNRAASNDSRVFGLVPLADVTGRVRQIWFSVNDAGIQWSRIGAVLNP